MRLKVLGSSSKGNCYILQGERETLLLECGLPWKEILKGLDFKIDDVSGCLVSHEHKDHSKALRELLKAGINVYTGFGTSMAIVKECNVIETYHRLHSIQSELIFKAGEFTVLPFETQHDAAEPLGFLIHHPELGKLLFITDSYYCRYKFTGLNHIMIECNYSSEILKQNIEQGLIPDGLAGRLMESHFSLANVKEFLKANDLRQVKDITLLHLSDGNSNAKQFKDEIEGLTGKPVYIADKGLEIELCL